MPCGHISECTDELPPTVREGAIQERRNIKMMNYLEIEKVIGREILDSRGGGVSGRWNSRSWCGAKWSFHR